MPRSGAEQRRRIVLEWENDSWQPRYAGAAILAKVVHGALHSRVASLPAISKQDQAIGSQVRQRDERASPKGSHVFKKSRYSCRRNDFSEAVLVCEAADDQGGHDPAGGLMGLYASANISVRSGPSIGHSALKMPRRSAARETLPGCCRPTPADL